MLVYNEMLYFTDEDGNGEIYFHDEYAATVIKVTKKEYEKCIKQLSAVSVVGQQKLILV